MNRIPCPLCNSEQRQPCWFQPAYPAVGGKVVELERTRTIPWLPLEISQCLGCGHIYQSQPPSADELEAFYQGSYITSDPSPALGGTPAKGIAAFCDLIGQTVGSRRGRALEIGAYDGYFLHLLEKAGWQATGYEPSEIGGIGKEFFKVDIRREFFRPGHRAETWDLVASRYVFEHLPAPREMLAGISSELSAGGWLALEVPDLQTRLREGILGCFAHEHISYFVPETLRRLVEEAGFVVRTIHNSRDGLALLAQKATTPLLVASPEARAETSRGISELVGHFLRKRLRQREQFRQELARWSGPRNFVIYGGDSHTTDLLVEGWLPAGEVSCIIDDDPAKQGRVAAGFTIQVTSRAQMPSPGEALVILSAFGHHDRLWENLADWRARGGAVMRFYPECQLTLPGR